MNSANESPGIVSTLPVSFAAYMNQVEKVCIKEYCNWLYEQLALSIDACRSSDGDSQRCIERCFHASEIARSRLDQFIRGYQFKDEAEEIWFFKFMRPQFAALVEFFILIYKSIMFCPDDDEEALKYWQHELERVKKFFRENAGIYLYLKHGDTHKDAAYFLLQPPGPIHPKRKMDAESETYHPHSQLAANCLARERFFVYVTDKIAEMAKGSQEVQKKFAPDGGNQLF